jgi:hypothetical protein
MSVTDASVLHGKIARARVISLPPAEKTLWAKPAATPRSSLMGRLFRRREPTIFQRCLAVHIHHAGQNGAMH